MHFFFAFKAHLIPCAGLREENVLREIMILVKHSCINRGPSVHVYTSSDET